MRNSQGHEFIKMIKSTIALGHLPINNNNITQLISTAKWGKKMNWEWKKNRPGKMNIKWINE